MSISEEILQNLLCTSCKKYLSIAPIKVYPNRLVKCGRCCEADDGGTESILYDVVTRDLSFPCINRMEGCEVKLPISEMGAHEGLCQGEKYCCPICPYVDYLFNFTFHIKDQHESLLLKNKEFYIDFEQESQENIFFYFDTGLLMYLTTRYESDCQQLTFSINVANQQTMNCKFFGYSIENKLLLKTQNIPCIKWGFLRDYFKVSVFAAAYPKRLAVCKFEINTEPILHLLENDPPIMDSSVSTALLKYSFENISEMKINISTYAKVPSYGVMNIPWKVLIIKVCEDDQYFLSVYLRKEDTPDCYITAKFTLVNTFQKNNIIRVITRRCITSTLGFKKFLKFDEIMNPLNGFIENDSIKIDALLKIEVIVEDNKNAGECNSCKRRYSSDESIIFNGKFIKKEKW